MTQRWTFKEIATGTTVMLPFNPLTMSNPYLKRSYDFAANARYATVAGVQNAPRPTEWVFGGPIREQAHHDLLVTWSKKPGMIEVVDHIGRRIQCIFQGVKINERRPTRNNPSRYTYEMNALVVSVQFSAFTEVDLESIYVHPPAALSPGGVIEAGPGELVEFILPTPIIDYGSNGYEFEFVMAPGSSATDSVNLASVLSVDETGYATSNWWTLYGPGAGDTPDPVGGVVTVQIGPDATWPGGGNQWGDAASEGLEFYVAVTAWPGNIFQSVRWQPL